MKNNGWKRAGCVLLAAQMTVSVLPMSSMAAYVDGQGRSGAILAAEYPETQRRLAARASFLLEKDRMPVMTKHRANVNSRSETALVASTETETSAAVETEVARPEDAIVEDTQTEAVIPDAAESVTPGEKETTDTAADPAPVETPATGEGEPAVSAPDEGETTDSVTDPEPEGSVPGEEGTTDSTPGEGETTDTVVDPEPGETPAPGGEEPVIPPEEETPVPPPAVKPEQTETKVMASAREQGEPMPLADMEFLYVSVYAYSYWASRSGSVHYKEGGGTESRFAPYAAEIHNDTAIGTGELIDNSGMSNPNYSAMYFYGSPIVNPELTDLASLQLDRIPDMRFEGWLFAQEQPENPNWYSSQDELAWYSRYRAGESEEPYEPTYEAIKAHANPYLSNDGAGFYVTNVISKWVPSDRAELTKLTLYGLSEDKDTGADQKETLEQYGERVDEGTGEKQEGTVDKEYTIQVSALTDRLTLDFTTYEPGTMIKITADTLEEPILYRYDREDYIWDGGAVTAEEYSKRNADTASKLEREQPGKRPSGGIGAVESEPTNSYDNPARANWSLPNDYAIPLNFTTPDQLYTTITITVVAPDGTIAEDGTTSGTTETYTLKVRRMADPEMTLNPGNTPYGMLESDISDPTDRQKAREDFDNSRTLPQHALGGHNSGGVYTGQYSEAAWKDTDCDKNVEALVVYQDTTFTDPGFTLIDSQGETADNTKTQRSIKLRRVSTLTTQSIKDGFGDEVYYNGGTSAEDGKEFVVDPAGKDVIDLRGMNVVPGIYSIEYSYTDPVSGVTYDSMNKSVYMDETKADHFSRPLIVLPQPGDIDMDGMVTLADAVALEKFISEGNVLLDDDNNDQVQRLFKYRVCDVDGNGQVDGNDVVTLKNGYVSHTVENISTDYFYLNSGDNGKPGRTPLVVESTSADRAVISIEYLGNNLDGVPTEATTSDPVEIGNTFWVGVKLENAGALPAAGTGVEAFEFTLVYNSNALRPGLLKGDTDWAKTIETANLSTGCATPWQSAYTLVGNSGAALPNGLSTVYVTYPELAQPTLSGGETSLATYTFALQRKPDAPAQSLKDGYLLLIPFYMNNHPIGKENEDVALVEPAMGGREFSVTYVDGKVSAWSNQDTIPGGHTVNLRDSLAYTGSDEIPVGKDTTEFIPLYDADGENAVYGETFSTQHSDLWNTGYGLRGGELPPGMSYNNADGTISTTNAQLGATKAGTYRFYIGTASSAKLYQITVDKAPLTLTVAGNSGKYYGEPNPRGDLVEFYYDNSQLKKQERDRLSAAGLASNENRGSNLLTVLGGDSGYVRPTITMIDDKGALLLPATPAGSYNVRLEKGEATNYVFHYADKDGQEADVATNTFQVAPRPILISEIPDSGVTIPNNTPASGRGFEATAKVGDFVAKLPTDTSGSYTLTGVAILSGDELEIQYTGLFLPNANDTSTEFVLNEKKEEREVQITKAELSGESVANYSLRGDSAILQAGAKTKGYVARMIVEKLTVENLGALIESDYTYGDTFSLSSLGRITLDWDNGTHTGPFNYADPAANPNANNHGVMLRWVDADGADPEKGTPAVNNEQFDVKRHNGKYLCIYVSNGEDAAPACVYVGPFKVNKKELTLTVYSEERYYGEAEKTCRVTYDSSALVGEDRKIITEGGGNQVSDLEALPGFSGTMKVERREKASVDSTLVTDKTNAGSYYVVISGAQADNYTIQYNQQRSAQSAAVVSGEFGCAPLTIHRRPILVTELTGILCDIYDDDDDAIQTGELSYPAAQAQTSGVSIQRPTQGAYYIPYGGSGAQQLTINEGDLAVTDAVLSGDVLAFTYRADYEKDRESKPYFDVTTGDWVGDGEKTYEVTVSGLLLKGNANDAGRNYQLVYSTAEQAMNGLPANNKGQGNVVIRRITELRVGTAPTFGIYEYGQKLQAENMTVYAIFNNNTNAPQQISYYDFEDYGLHLEWTDKETNDVASGKGDPAVHGQVLTVVDHNGRKLVVRGRRHSEHEEVSVVFGTPIEVNKKTLHVKADGTERVYGQNNFSSLYPEYRATVAWDDLADADKDKLTAAGYSAVAKPVTIHSATLSQGSASEGLALLDKTAIWPQFTTAAAGEKVGAGKYDLNLTGGQMANYTFALEAGAITVIPRPIMLESVDKYPLATITQGSTVLSQSGAIASSRGDQASFKLVKDGVHSITGSPVMDGDEIVVSMTVHFGFYQNGNRYPTGDTSWMDLSGVDTRTAHVKISDIKLVSGSENYVLVENPDLSNRVFKDLGRVDGRQISAVMKNESYAPKLSYTYGEGLDLSGVTLDIQYNTSAQTTWERNVPVGNHQSLKVFYLANPAQADTAEGRKAIVEGGLQADACRPAQANDHLTIVRDGDGFTHNGKYLVVIVQQVNPNYDPGDPSKGDHYTYNIAPIQVGQLTVAQKQLEYTLMANDREYDGTTQGTGYVLVEKDQIYGSDQVFIVNGTAYGDMSDVQSEEYGGRDYYRFDSGNTGVTFTFSDPNVAYERLPDHDSGVYATVPVGVSGIDITGTDAGNYTVVRNVASTANNAPAAVISRSSKRAQPDAATLAALAGMASRTTMSTDIHTNTVTVSVAADAARDFGDLRDIYNRELHFEYRLEYLEDENDSASGSIVEGGDSRFFGGEPVRVDSEEFVPAPGEENLLTPGMGQHAVAGDSDFGTRLALPRDTYFRAQIRLAQTHNYEASVYIPSVSDDAFVAAIAQARAEEESDELSNIAGKPEETEPPRPIPDGRPLGKTYQYRFDMVAVQTMKGEDGEEHVRSQLDSVWFADRATYPREEFLNALTTDPAEPRYHNYAWDPQQRQSVRFPVDMRDEIKANLPQGDGSTAETTVNADGTARMYVSLIPHNGSGVFYQVTILEDNIIAYLGDDPLQLTAQLIPSVASSLSWRSSDTSVVTVDNDGLLTFVGEGVARIYVSFAGFSDSIQVVVLPPKELLPEGLFNVDYLNAFMDLTDDLMFHPERTVSRGELAVILVKLLSPAVLEQEGEELVYVDIAETMDCAQAVELLSRWGIFNGVGESHFAPEQAATRAEMAAVLVRMGQLPEAPEEAFSFVDSGPEDTWAWAEIKALAYAGITDGTGDYCFSPNRLLTRAETAAFLTRMLRYKLDLTQEDLKYPVDVENGYWAWEEIIRAVNNVETTELINTRQLKGINSRNAVQKYM